MSQNMDKSMKNNRRSRGGKLFAGASAAALAAGLSANAHAGDADRHRLELGLGVSRLNIDAPTETFEPFWADDWDDTNYALPLSASNPDVEADLGRELWLRFRPRNSDWSLTLGVRDGSARRSIDTHQTEPRPGSIPGCSDPIPYCTGFTGYIRNPDFVSALAERREAFEIVDFTVGRDVGLGFLREGGESRVDFGLRYANFESATTGVELRGQPNRYDPEVPTFAELLAGLYGGENIFKYHNADTFEADFESRREFEGWGPSASWTASQPLFGNERAGHVLLDWTLGGGVLFGKQKTEVDRDEASRYYSWPVINGVCGPTGCAEGDPPGSVGPLSDAEPAEEELDSASHDREERLVTVPFVDLDLGFSYKLERMRVSLGYRFEEYFGAIDGGVNERKVYDRTFEGPYLRFSVGLFGDEGE